MIEKTRNYLRGYRRSLKEKSAKCRGMNLSFPRNPRNTICHTHQLGFVRPGIFLPKTVVALHEDIYFGSSFSILR